jgi:hypothetical protein
MQFIYALVYKDGSLIGSCYFQIVHFKGTNLTSYFPEAGNNKLKNIVVNLLKAAIAKIDFPLLVSGNLFITGEQGIYY